MRVLRWVLGVAIGAAVVAVPFGYYRATYTHAKRLRVVTEDRFYRCGQLPADGFRDAFRLYGIKTVVNLQEEARDPILPRTWLESWLKKQSVSERELCESCGVKYVSLDGGVLDHAGDDTGSRPVVIDEFLAVLDDESNYPILIHCKAGLHRTGLMTAIYRMDKEHRSKDQAVRELRANGFGTFAATDGNLYLKRFIIDFEPGVRRTAGRKGGE
jgi:tyrosine-protein phosphatase SIW14